MSAVDRAAETFREGPFGTSLMGEALLEIRRRLNALERHALAPHAPDASDLIALAAVVLDEAEGFARQRVDIRDQSIDCIGVVLDVHALRCRSLYQKLCVSPVEDQTQTRRYLLAETEKVAQERKTVDQLRVSLMDARGQIEKLEAFENAVAYGLGAERNPDLALDALKARLEERELYQKFLLDVGEVIGLPGSTASHTNAEYMLQILKERLNKKEAP